MVMALVQNASEVATGISNRLVWFTIKCMLLVDITTALHLRLYNDYTLIYRITMYENNPLENVYLLLTYNMLMLI